MATTRLTGDDWWLLREVRLAALADAPHAYGSTLAREEAFGEAEWRQRLDGGGLWTVARHGDETVGLVGAFLPDDTPMLVAMWVRPGSRGLGFGDELITDVLRWAGENRWSGSCCGSRTATTRRGSCSSDTGSSRPGRVNRWRVTPGCAPNCCRVRYNVNIT
jgi:GNAT superfamily N-acetyltransferase